MAAATRAVSRFSTSGGNVNPFVQMSRIFLVLSCRSKGREGEEEDGDEERVSFRSRWGEQVERGRGGKERVKLNELVLQRLPSSRKRESNTSSYL